MVRKDIATRLEKNFNNPQVDVSISKFNSRRNVYVLGEVVRLDNRSWIGAITLAELISDGLSQTTSNAKKLVMKSEDTKEQYFMPT